MHTGKNAVGEFDPAFYASALDAFTANVAILDREGRILSVNAAWLQFIDLNGFQLVDYGVGCDYLAFCDRLGTPGGDTVAAGLRALIAGADGPFRHEYIMPLDTGSRWVKLSAVRVGHLDQPFLIVAHEDISIQRRAELGLREATARLLLAEDAERRRIARELHDSTAQYLAGAKLMLRRLDAKDPVSCSQVRDEVEGLLSSALDEIRSFAYLLHPPALEHLGLAAAIRQFATGFARRAEMAVTIDIPEDFPRLSHATEIALYRVVQEALANVHSHSGSQQAIVRLRVAGEMVLLTVRDFGSGLPPRRDSVPGVGLEGMRLRLEFLKGHLSLRNAEPGLALEAWAPFLPENED
ncbi:histidine kinase [Caulobacter soli]|uniref:sensor histidine kinase n=1 Tax=Caulobacter soli TaxID=2708539 RepID=UPI0013EB5CF5|nr:histidine kinase [Caulobacter soli]